MLVMNLLQFKAEISKITPKFFFLFEELEIDGCTLNEAPRLRNFDALFEKKF